MKLIHCHPNPHTKALLTGYLHDEDSVMSQSRGPRPAVLVCPGGGYEYCSDREAEPIALSFYEKGYQAFVLYYSLKEEAGAMRPLMDASLSMILLRDNAKDWQIDPDHIAVAGFSAGGHVAASLGILWDHEELKAKMDTQKGRNRPNAMILGYPVITAGPLTHAESIYWVSGQHDMGTPENEFWALDRHVDEKTVPTFVWHTVEDDCVPVENTLRLVTALQAHHVPFACHIFPRGGHGMSLCNQEVCTPNAAAAAWVPLCHQWLAGEFSFVY